MIRNKLSRWVREKYLAPQMRMRASQFAHLRPEPGKVVFLGDSITEGGLWHEWFPEHPVLNRGIGGNTVDEVAERLDTALTDPSAVFLLIGTNDLGMGAGVQETASRCRDLVADLRTRAPHAPLFVQSVMPRQHKFADQIRQLNTHYQRIADDADATYIDLWPALDDGSGQLRGEFTLDLLHLNGAGYAAWVRELQPHLALLVARRDAAS
ncbi:MAG: hypothetical protein HOV66_09280 [Streptomycetaceae bacterium]|nr:hypothetical protein [Streptomycetaceae bacterium]